MYELEGRISEERCCELIAVLRDKMPLDQDRQEPYRPTDNFTTRDAVRPLLLDLFPEEWMQAFVMVLYPGRDIDPHLDNGIPRYRRHIVLQTNPKVVVKHDGVEQTLELGGIYSMDPEVTHSAHNGGTTDRIHLVVDIAPGGTDGKVQTAG